MKKILITGGAGFVGSRLALHILESEGKSEITVVDNLRRAGSRQHLEELTSHGVRFFHGDIRKAEDLDAISGTFDGVIDAAADASVLAGSGNESTARYVVETNLLGTLNCLEFCRKRAGGMIFMSTSRVYSIQALSERWTQSHEPFVVDEEFSTDGFRSIYGATKLASEILIAEYVQAFDLRAYINRCSVIAGAGQWGTEHQGVYALWPIAHVLGQRLSYTGFGGAGIQVRDLLHPVDLARLVMIQLGELSKARGEIFNIGGGIDNATSLENYTKICREVSASVVPVEGRAESHCYDIPCYVSDISRAEKRFGWKPLFGVPQIVREITAWARAHKSELSLNYRTLQKTA